MPEFGTPEFDQFWRLHGFFGTVDNIVSIGASQHTIRTGVSSGLTGTNASILQEDLAEMRNELTKIRAALDRIASDIQPGLSGGTIDQFRLEQNLISLGGWFASALQTVGAMSYYLSEPGLAKVHGFLKPQMTQFESHASRRVDRAERGSAPARKPSVRRPRF